MSVKDATKLQKNNRLGVFETRGRGRHWTYEGWHGG